VPDGDPPAGELLEFSPSGSGPPVRQANPVRTRLFIAGAAVAVAVIALVTVFAGIKPGSAPRAAHAAASHVNPALARLITQVTSIPVRTTDAAGDGGGQVTAKPVPVTGPPLAANGKPEVFYAGTQYCPFCAMQSWAMIVALSRFGTFTGLSTIRSAFYDLTPPLAGWTFYRSSYTSRYLTFVSVETRSNILISPSADPQSGDSYTKLQTTTAAQEATFSKYDKERAVPFLDLGNKYVLIGSSFPEALLEQQTWSQIAAALRNPGSVTGQAILGTANYITAAICALTGDQPASACTPAVRSLLAT
jgi:hypothetical protein